MRRTHAVHLAGALLLTTFGCVQEEPAFEVAETGGARLVVALPRSLSATPVTEVTSTVTPASGTAKSTTLTADTGLWTGDVERGDSGSEVGLRVDARDATGAVVATVSLESVPLALYEIGRASCRERVL